MDKYKGLVISDRAKAVKILNEQYEKGYRLISSDNNYYIFEKRADNKKESDLKQEMLKSLNCININLEIIQNKLELYHISDIKYILNNTIGIVADIIQKAKES